MSIFGEFLEDFHYYVGRKLGLSSAEINSGLADLAGKPTNFSGHYRVLKKHADTKIKRAFIIEMLKFKIAEFMGTQIYKDHYLKIDKATEKIELERLEYFLSFIFDPDSDWGKWRKMMVELCLETPTENVNLVGELKRLCLPICYAGKINNKAIKFYSPDRRLRNLALTALDSAKHTPEIKTAIKIQVIFLESYYRGMGIDVCLCKYKGNFFTKLRNSLTPTILPFLPKLPLGWYYDPCFYEHIRNIVRGEHNLFKIEWDFLGTIRVANHSILVKSFDRCTNDILECVSSIKDLLFIEPSSVPKQEQSLMLLRGDVGECILNNYGDLSGFTTEKEYDFMRLWYDKDPVYVVCSILKSYNDDGTFNHKKMECLVKARFRCRPHQLKKLKSMICY